MVYCTYANVNLITNIISDDVANADVTSIIAEATKELNSFINVQIVREKVEYIDTTRENKIDGSNTIYYIQNWNGKYFADRDDDGDVDTSDVIVYLVDGDGNETIATVSDIDVDDCYVTLSSAPSSSTKIYITYDWCYKNASTPDPMIKLACTFLSAAYCYAKLNIGRAPQVKFGNSRFYRHIDSYEMYYNRAMKIIDKINESGGLADYSESLVV